MYDDENNDASSNPQADEHLPVAGEFDPEGTPSDDNPLAHDTDDEESDEVDLGDEQGLEGGEDEDGFEDEITDPNNINEISAKHTDDIEEAPDPDGPANPTATTSDSSL